MIILEICSSRKHSESFQNFNFWKFSMERTCMKHSELLFAWIQRERGLEKAQKRIYSAHDTVFPFRLPHIFQLLFLIFRPQDLILYSWRILLKFLKIPSRWRSIPFPIHSKRKNSRRERVYENERRQRKRHSNAFLTAFACLVFHQN